MKEAARSIKEIGNILIQASNRKPSHLLIAGDFNITEIDWETEYVNNEPTRRNIKFARSNNN